MPVDMSTALNSAFAISAALYRKATTGEGQYIDIAMLDTAIIMQASQFSNYLNQSTLIGLRGNASPTGQPTANVFPTMNGHIQITTLRQPQVEKLFTELGLKQMLEDTKFATTDSRINHPQEIFDALSQALNRQTTQAWMKQLAPAGIPVAEVRELPEVASDPDIAHRNALVTLPSPLDPDATVTVAKAGYVTNVDGPEVRSGPPILGADTEDILTKLGYEPKEIGRLRNTGVI
jgi:formyl-CoA transferase